MVAHFPFPPSPGPSISCFAGDGANGQGGWPSLRENLLYRSKSFYLSIAVVNLMLRFFWTLTLIPEGKGDAWQKNIQVRLSPILAGAEICRRCMWGFLRLENEHLHVYGTAIDDSFTQEDMSQLSVRTH